ncbi:MAG: hypothetical protein FK734_07505 [Asgard group archaeon]|nr:hypothetical protein [Asgard group archaeon]
MTIVDNEKKSRDLDQAFEKLLLKYKEFKDEQTLQGLERSEIEQLIMQVNRLHDKLNKLMNIVGRNYST